MARIPVSGHYDLQAGQFLSTWHITGSVLPGEEKVQPLHFTWSLREVLELGQHGHLLLSLHSLCLVRNYLAMRGLSPACSFPAPAQ